MHEVSLFEKAIDLADIEAEMRKHEEVDCPISHNFSPGVYVRTMFIPAGTLIMGKRHRHETCNILSQGEISIYMGKDTPAVRLVAPCIFNSMPGTKKLGFAHTDVIFSNVHPTNETDVEKIECEVIIPEQEYLANLGEE